MNKNKWLSKLYYDLGKQKTNEMKVQNSFINNEGDKIFYKREYALDVIGTNKKYSHRTLLKNEIVLDLDPEPDMKKTLKEVIEDIKNKLKYNNFRYVIYFTGSRGYHIHIYDNYMFKLNLSDRIKYRHQVCSNLSKFYDKMICAENHMIAMEFTEHWKTGKIKDIINQRGVV